MAMTRAIVSRCRVFELKSLTADDLKKGIERAVADKERGLGNYNISITDEAKAHLAWSSSGDMRNALNGLELAVLSTPADEKGVIKIDKAVIEQCVQKKSFAISESTFYDMLSAFCKSLRGSSADAALYWAFALIESGCDPLILFRRMIAHSSEDVGMADSGALEFVVKAMEAYKNTGMPEGELPLAHAIIRVACAEKSNRVLIAKDAAKAAVKSVGDIFVPLHLRNNSNSTFEKSTVSYLYPHDFGGYIKQDYLPSQLKNAEFYKPSDNGDEKQIKELLAKIRK